MVSIAKKLANSNLAWVAGLCLVFGLVACSNRHETSETRDEMARASYLIDQGQYSEAIYILNEKLKAEPGHPKARVLLASAYAGRAGLKFIQYKDFASAVLTWDTNGSNALAASRDPVIRTIAQTIWQIQVVLRAFDAVPAPTEKNGYDDLRTALEILDEGGRLYEGASLYRALIRIVVFKQDLVTRYQLRAENGCYIEIPQLARWFETIERELSMLMTDYAYSMKDGEKRKGTLSMVAQMRRSGEDVRRTLSGARADRNINLIEGAISQDPSCAR